MTRKTVITVTGGSGFIGTSLCRILSNRRVDFSIIDRRESAAFPGHTRQMDICDLQSLRNANIGQHIVHLAAEHRDDIQDRSRYKKVNVEGTRNLVRVAVEKSVYRIVFTSSVAVFGFAPPDTGEDGRIAPFNDYGRTKHEAELVLREWQAADPQVRSLTIVRPTVVFGPGNRGNVYNLLSFIASGRFLMVGPGTNRKSMAYVENVAAFLELATTFGPGVHLYNYVDKPDLTMNELVGQVRQTLFGKSDVGPRLPAWLGLAAGTAADVVSRTTNRTLPISAIRIKKFTATTAFASAATTVPGFVPKFTLAEGLARTLRHEFIDPDPTAPIFYTE
jgi:nucleoside-diphosphate-sugar epimerase